MLFTCARNRKTSLSPPRCPTTIFVSITFALTLLLFQFALGQDSFAVLRANVQQPQFRAATAGLDQWIALVGQNKSVDRIAQIQATNDFFNNQLTFQDDNTIWGVKDYWATPLESLAKNSGDCEDFALAKYVTLLAMGVEENQLQLVYVQAQLDRIPPKLQAHMVLAYYSSANADPLILDNLSRELRKASERTDLTPIFSFNASSLWVAGQAKGDSKSRLSQWQAVLSRIQNQGFFDP